MELIIFAIILWAIAANYGFWPAFWCFVVVLLFSGCSRR